MRRQQAKPVLEVLEGRTLFNGTISGTVHNDINGSGATDEFSTTPVTRIYLDRNDDGRRNNGEESVLTDASGAYEFKNVAGGSYVVRPEFPTGFVPSGRSAHVGELVRFRGSSAVHLDAFQIRYATSPWQTVGQNAQHTGISPFAGGPLTSTPQEVTVAAATGTQVQLQDPGFKLGTPLFTKYDTVIAPGFNTETGKYVVSAYSRSFGQLLWTFTSDYTLAPSLQLGVRAVTSAFQPALGPDGRLYIPGAGGTVFVIAAPDQFGLLKTEGSGTAVTATRVKTGTRVAFYGMDKYHAKAGRYRSTVFINTPLTVGPDGDVYFGVEATGTNPEGVKSSLARVRADGTGSRVAAAVVAGGAPALSNDGRYVYVTTQSGGKARLERYRGVGQLTAAGSVVLTDPANGKRLALVAGDVALPVVAPDGDVYLAAPARAAVVTDTFNGWLLRFSDDLKVKGTKATVAGDATPSIVPAGMVRTYHGKSSYLIAAVRLLGQDERTSGVDIQRLGLYDPAKGLRRTGAEFFIAAVNSNPSDTSSQLTLGFVSSPVVVDPSNKAIYLVNASEQLLRWNLSDPTLITAPLALGSSVEGEGNSPVVIGPDGETYAAVGGKLFAAF